MPNDSTTSLTVPVLDPNVAIASKDGWKQQWDQWVQMLDARILPSHVKSPQQAIALSKLGAAYGWNPIQCCIKLCIISGKVTMYAETLMELMQGYCASHPGNAVWPVEQSVEQASIGVKREDWPQHFEFVFSQQDAKTAGLWGSGTWAKYPKAMLWARCVSMVSRGGFSDVTGGLFVREEFTPDRVMVTQLEDNTPLETALGAEEPEAALT